MAPLPEPEQQLGDVVAAAAVAERWLSHQLAGIGLVLFF